MVACRLNLWRPSTMLMSIVMIWLSEFYWETKSIVSCHMPVLNDVGRVVSAIHHPHPHPHPHPPTPTHPDPHTHTHPTPHPPPHTPPHIPRPTPPTPTPTHPTIHTTPHTPHSHANQWDTINEIWWSVDAQIGNINFNKVHNACPGSL